MHGPPAAGPLRLIPAGRDEDAAMARWTGPEELRAMTCRPVGKDGRRAAPAAAAARLAFLTADGRVAGRFTVFDANPRNGAAEFGYLLAPDLRGTGLGAALVAHGLDAWFRAAALRKLHAQTAAFNEPSRRLLERLGLARDGALREHHERDGLFHDDLIYSLLFREWAAAPWRGCADPQSVAAARDAASTLGIAAREDPA